MAGACIPVPFRRYRDREVGGGRATRQPGQVRKEAALTSSGSGRSSASHPFHPRYSGMRGLDPRIHFCGNEGCGGATEGMNDATTPDQGSGYRVLARKYRPATFDDLIGQEAMVRTISNAFEAGRIPQAWILTGVRGVGKTTTARILARAL